MSKSPAVLFYTADFLIGTSFFTNEQVGQYVRLLCHQHQNGPLSEANMCKILESTYVDSQNPVVKKFTKNEDGNYYQQRMALEIDKRANYSESRRSNINNRYVDKSKSTYVPTYVPTYVSTHVVHMENDNGNDNDNSNGNTSSKNKKVELKNNRGNTAVIPQYQNTFAIFWQAYPNKSDKKRCLAIWSKIDFKENPFPTILEKLETLKASWGWTKDGGQFIPMAKTWLNREGWNDTIKTEPPPKESIYI
jgi:uncharacterized protein YdaU (DUF1376 family)